MIYCPFYILLIQFTFIWLRNFVSVIMKEIGMYFTIFVASLSEVILNKYDRYVGLKNDLGMFLFPLYSERVLWDWCLFFFNVWHQIHQEDHFEHVRMKCSLWSGFWCHIKALYYKLGFKFFVTSYVRFGKLSFSKDIYLFHLNTEFGALNNRCCCWFLF